MPVRRPRSFVPFGLGIKHRAAAEDLDLLFLLFPDKLIGLRQPLEFPLPPAAARTISPGTRVIAQHRLKTLAAGFVEPLVQIAIHQLDQFTALRRLF